MTRIIFLITAIFILNVVNSYSQGRTLPEIEPNPSTINMARMLGKDIFELNGLPYLQPTVEVINVTSNSRFYNKAFIPSKVDKPYFKVGIHGMYGVVPDAKKWYSPQLPNDSITTEKLLKYGSINPLDWSFTINDTAGLIYTALKGILFDGLKNGSIKVPQRAPTSLGSGKVAFNLPPDTLKNLLRNLEIELPILGKTKVYDYLPPRVQDTLNNILGSFPDFFNLPEGGNLNYIFAMVPQIEIGSLFGTELLLRFIPPVKMDSTIGKFAFWGVGIKHSISQYFNKGDEPENRYFDMAVQVGYQGTSLENKIGVTNTTLKANATMWNFNMHASKHFEDICDVYTGLSYSLINIESEYKYYLPIEMQWQLGLIDKYYYKTDTDTPNFKPTKAGDTEDTKYDHPGDQNPQTAITKLSDKALVWNIGISRDIGPVTVFVDFNISKLNIFTGGVVYNF